MSPQKPGQARTRRWVQSLVFPPGRWRQEDEEFKSILGYVASLRLAWVREDAISKQTSKIKQQNKTIPQCRLEHTGIRGINHAWGQNKHAFSGDPKCVGPPLTDPVAFHPKNCCYISPPHAPWLPTFLEMIAGHLHVASSLAGRVRYPGQQHIAGQRAGPTGASARWLPVFEPTAGL